MQEKLWFKAKRYGWGWTPVTWQGWVSILVFVVLTFWIYYPFDQEILSVSDITVRFLLPEAVLVGLLIWLCYKKGEKPGWRWGDKAKS